MDILRIKNKYVAVALFLMLVCCFAGTGLWCIEIYVAEKTCQ